MSEVLRGVAFMMPLVETESCVGGWVLTFEPVSGRPRVVRRFLFDDDAQAAMNDLRAGASLDEVAAREYGRTP